MFNPAHRRRLGVLIAVTAMLALSAVAAVAAAPAGAEAQHHDDDGYQQLNLVSDVPGAAQLLDPNLVNAWGMSSSPTSPIWVSDNGSNNSTLYRGATMPGRRPASCRWSYRSLAAHPPVRCSTAPVTSATHRRPGCLHLRW